MNSGDSAALYCEPSTSQPQRRRGCMGSIKEQFEAAVRLIHGLPKDGWSLHSVVYEFIFHQYTGPYQTSNETKLKFYALYKQATQGTCKGGRPAFWDVINRAKW